MRTPKHIAVVTGSRAEFGLLASVMRAIAGHDALRLRTLVAGSHLVNETWRDVAGAGFDIDAQVLMQRAGETGRASDVIALADGVAGFGRAFESLNPDAVLVLGDRIEAFAAASAASVGGLLLVHLHGGDRAQGVADEAMRHAISKLAHLHGPATEQSAKRLRRMGEPPTCIRVVGSPAVDGLDEIAPMPNPPAIVLMHHPVGDPVAVEQQRMATLLAATRDHLLGSRVLFMPNLDPGQAGVVAAIESERDLDPALNVVTHLPRTAFVGMLKGSQVIVGNSSAGLIEAAALRRACVNVGSRQQGRESPGNVVNVPDADLTTAQLRATITRAASRDLSQMTHPYGDGRTGERVAEWLASINLGELPRRKCSVL